jgi:hypothetical protein
VFNNKTIVSIIILAAFFAVVLGLNWFGISRRVGLREKTVLSVDSPEKIYEAWEARKVRGRILLLFGTYPHFTRTADYEGVRELTALNFVEFSAFNNLVRKIYMIVPDDQWEDIRNQPSIGALRKVPGMERGLYLYTLVGIPIIATTPTSLPPLSETTLVYINSRTFDKAFVQDILSSRGINTDITILYGSR